MKPYNNGAKNKIIKNLKNSPIIEHVHRVKRIINQIMKIVLREKRHKNTTLGILEIKLINSVVNRFKFYRNK